MIIVSALNPFTPLFLLFTGTVGLGGLFGQGHGLGLDNFVWHLCVKKVVLRLFDDLSLLFWTETLTIINELWHHVIEMSSQKKSLKLHTRLKFTQSILYKILRALSYLTPLGEIISWRAPIVLFKVLNHDWQLLCMVFLTLDLHFSLDLSIKCQSKTVGNKLIFYGQACINTTCNWYAEV